MSTTESTRRDWIWDNDNELDGRYVETRQVMIKSGPSAGSTKLVFDFQVGDELVSVWEASVIRSKLASELKLRQKPDFEPGERMRIKSLGWKEGQNGNYRNFDVWFEHGAPKPTAADLLSADDANGDATGDANGDQSTDDDIPF
jgi:hypothetical protein